MNAEAAGSSSIGGTLLANMMTAPASRPDSKEDLSELAGTRPTPVKLQVNQQNQTVTRPSKTMSTSGAPGLAADEVAGDVNERTSDIATPSRDGSSRGSTSSSSSSTTTTMRPVEHQTNSTLHEEDHKEQGSNKEDEQTDLETSGTELSSKKHHQANDSTEAQENRLSSVVADPNEEDPQFGAASSNGTMSKSDDMMDENEPDLVDFDSDDEQQQLSRRLFLSKHNKPNSVADEFKRLKNQGSKLLAKNPLKRKKSKKKAKPMRPRLGTTTVDYGNMISAYSNNHHHHHHHGGLPAGSPLNSQVSATNAISNTIRQHFPAMLANPTQQLSTTVQKLIMSKLSPSASNQQAQTVLAGLQGKRPLHNHAQLMAPNHGLYQQHQPGSYLDNARIVEALSQLASSNEDSSPMGFASSANHKPHIQASLPLGAQQQGNKMIPIEIIGLDPTVTNNILQSYDSEQGATGVGQSAPPLGDPMQVYPGHHEPAIYHHQDSSGQQALAQQLQQLQAAKAADGSSKSFPRASSILHIHHFHTPPSKAGGGPQAQLVAGAEADQQEPGGMRAPSPQQQAPQRVVANGKTTQQKVYINDKGQVVYLSVEDQSEGKGQAGGEQPQPDGSAGEQAQLQAMSDGHETRPGGDTGGQLSEQQQQEYQQAQQEYAQAPNGLQVETDQQHQVDASSNQQEPQQVETISLANGDQPMGLQANGVFKTLLNPLYGGQQQLVYRNMSKLGEPRQKVYLASKGHAISLIGGRENDGLPAGEGESGEKQQLLMVSYKPQQQIRNVTDDLLPGQRNPYNEGQESKPSFIAANHLLAGAPQLLKGSSLMLRPFQSQLTSGRFGSPFFVNNSGSAMDDFNYDLMRLRQQQQSLNLSDIMARLNGTHSLGADLAHLDALRTGNKSSHLHGMLTTVSTPLQPVVASPTSESIPLTIVPIHQAANTSYQLGAQLQSGRLSPQENRVPFQTSPALKALISDMANNNIHPALLAANHSRPIELASVQSSWLVPDMMDKLSASLQSNGYNAKAALSAITALRNNGTMFGGSSLTSPSSQNFLIENLTFLKHLRELKERLKQANAESDPQLISHHHLLSLNSTNKLSNDDLLSLINGLRLNNGSTTSINLTQQLQPHSSLPIIESFQAPSGLASLEPIARPNKFGLPQSSSPAPQLARPPLHAITLPVGASSALDGSIQNNNSKHIRSKIGSSNSANLSSAHTGLINNDHHQRNQQHQRSNGHNNKDHRTAMESQQSDVSVDRPMPPTPGQMDKHHPQVISMISDDSEFASDNNGLGTIALAFIFISLITLTLLAGKLCFKSTP